MTAPTNPRSIREERAFLDADVDDLRAIHDAVIELGESPRVARNLVGWLVLKQTGGEDRTSSNTRSEYRKIIARIANGDGDGNGSGNGRRSERGAAGRKALEVIGGGAGTVLAFGVNPAVGACAAVLYITGIMGARSAPRKEGGLR